MAKWKVVFDVAQDVYEVVSGKTKEEAVKKVIDRDASPVVPKNHICKLHLAFIMKINYSNT